MRRIFITALLALAACTTEPTLAPDTPPVTLSGEITRADHQTYRELPFTVPPGTPRAESIRLGQEDNEPRCLVEGVRRVVNRDVMLHFHRVVARKK